MGPMNTERCPSGLSDLTERAGAVANDVAAVTVGLGILGANRLGVVRRQVTSWLSSVRVPPSSDDS